MDMHMMYDQLGISRAVYEYGETVLRDLKERFEAIDIRCGTVDWGKIIKKLFRR